MVTTKTDVIKVVYNEGEDKPWMLDFEDVGVMKTARAALNYPAQKFETEEKAVEVAEMLRDIIHANAVALPEEDIVLDDVEPAEFFQPISSEGKPNPELGAETERETFIEEDIIVPPRNISSTDNPARDYEPTGVGESQAEVDSQYGYDDEPYTVADKIQEEQRYHNTA